MFTKRKLLIVLGIIVAVLITFYTDVFGRTTKVIVERPEVDFDIAIPGLMPHPTVPVIRFNPSAEWFLPNQNLSLTLSL